METTTSGEIMRMLLKWEIGLVAGNDAIRNGVMGEVSEQLMATVKPEAAYFATENGRRTAYLVFDMTDAAQIPVIAEPLFQRLGSKVEFIPVMNHDDLLRGLTTVAEAHR